MKRRSYSSEANSTETPNPDATTPIVYMTTDISPEGLMAVYEAHGITPTGNVAVKITTGEPPKSNYLRPTLPMWTFKTQTAHTVPESEERIATNFIR